jgi:hypothetical protein
MIDRETATFIGCFGGSSISGIKSSFLTKLGSAKGESFLPWAARSLRKESSVEGGGRGGGSPPPEITIATAGLGRQSSRTLNRIHCFLLLQMSKLYLVENMFTIYFVGKSMLEDET